MTTSDTEQTLRPAIWAAVDAWGAFIAATEADLGAYERQRGSDPDAAWQAPFDAAIAQVERAAQELGGWLWEPDIDRIRAAAYLRYLTDSRRQWVAPFVTDEQQVSDYATRAGRAVNNVVANVEHAAGGWKPHPLDDHHTREWRRLEVDELATYSHPAHRQAVIDALAARRTWAAPLAHLRAAVGGDPPLRYQDVAYLGNQDPHLSLPKRLLAAAQAAAAADRGAQTALAELGLHFTAGVHLLGLPYDPARHPIDEFIVSGLLPEPERRTAENRSTVGPDQKMRRHR